MSDTRRVELDTKEIQEFPGEDKWHKPFAKTEKFEKLKPSLSRDFRLKTGETMTVTLSDPEEFNNTNTNPRRKELIVTLKNVNDDFHYDVEARIPRYPNSNRIGKPEFTDSAIGYELWETEEIGSGINDDLKPETGDSIPATPFLCNHMDEIDTLEIRYQRIKI